MTDRRRSLLSTILVVLLAHVTTPRPATAQDEAKQAAAELARIKQAEAQERLKELEETMDRLARLLSTTEPRNAQKLRTAFEESRERLVREGMGRVVEFLRERKLDRALESQASVARNLDELLSILLEKDISPRELLKHIKRLTGVLADLDRVVEEETTEKIASDQAAEAESPIETLSGALVELDALIGREKAIEAKIAGATGNASGEGKDGGGGQEGKGGKGGKDGKGGEGEPGGQGDTPDREPEKDPEVARKLRDVATEQENVQSGTAKLRKSHEPGGGPFDLDRDRLAAAEAAMAGASSAMKGGAGGEAAGKAAEARKALEAARRDAAEKLDELRRRRDFATMKKAQDDTTERTKDVLERMKTTPPLVSSPEGGVPGRGDVEAASGSMESASESLGGGKARPASRSQKDALTKLNEGRRKVEETLEELQRALRERLLAYLRERFTHMLDRQRGLSRETKSLDSRLRALATVAAASGSTSADPVPADGAEGVPEAAIDRKDLQKAKSLALGEEDLRLVAEDVIDLLEEDGTTLVFPRIVGGLEADLRNVTGLLDAVRTGALTQRIQKEIEETLVEILEAIKQAQKSPPPPNPNQGRRSRSGAGPLLPTSAELKMIRSMQARLNERTRRFDLDRAVEELDLEEKRQARALADRQKEIEDLLRKVGRSL